MISDLRRISSSFFLLLLLVFSVLLRIIFQTFYLPNTVSDFGPDEGTYATLAKYVSEGKPVQEFPQYGPGLYNSARTLILPSSLLIRLGANELDAVRATATLFGFLSLLFLILCYLALIKFFNLRKNLANLELNFLQKCIFVLFAFMPSNFLWSTLGLRESGSQLFLLSFTYFAIKILASEKVLISGYFLPATLSLALAFGARRETTLVFTLVALIFSLAIWWRTRNSSITAAVLIGFVLGQIFTTTPMVEVKQEFKVTLLAEQKNKFPTPIESGESKAPTPIESGESKAPTPIESGESKAPTPIESGESKAPTPIKSGESKPPISERTIASKCKKDKDIIVADTNRYRCVLQTDVIVQKLDPVESTASQVLATKILEYKRNVNRIEAQSALPESECKYNLPGALNILACNLVELPYRLPTFLFRPLPLIDSGSEFLRLAGTENLIWLTLILTSFYTLIRSFKLKSNRFLLSWLFSYWITFSTAASLYEGNLGTAFRHKSTILWAIVLGLLFSYKNSNFNLRKLRLFKDEVASERLS
jgi:hypothetical protein